MKKKSKKRASAPPSDANPISAKAAEVRAWKARWDAVNAYQFEEHRRLTPAERLRQFFSLMEMARAMKWKTSSPEETKEVMARWNKLRKAYGV